jgi:hypothetical protein
MLADELDYVIGVDTHRDEHVLAVLTAAAGAVVTGAALPANARGYRETLRFAGRYAAGRRAWAIEGTGSYGAGLARFLAGCGETVLEVSRTPRAERRLRGKDDTLDAARTARAALASDTLALPRSGERREALRLPSGCAKNCADYPPGSCSTAAAACDAAAKQAWTSSQPSSCSAASRGASKQPRSRLLSSNATSLATCVRSHPRCSTSRASARSSPRN